VYYTVLDREKRAPLLPPTINGVSKHELINVLQMKPSLDILVWDCSSCPSRTIDFIPELQRLRKSSFGTIIVFASDPHTIPAALGNLATSLPLVVRFGPNALHDAIIDVIGALVPAKGQGSVIVVTGAFPIWISLFYGLAPRSVVFVSNKDITSCFDFNFFPQTVPVKLLTWPELTETRSSGGDLIDLAPAPVQDEEEDNEEEEPTQGHFSPGNFGEDDADGIQPLANLERYQIDLRSPAGTPKSQQPGSPEPTAKRRTPTHEGAIPIPVKFQPLVEAMKSTGKALISLNDLEGQLKVWSAKLNQPVENINTYIAKATDAQIVIYDKAINYVRFRNRAIVTSDVEYV
jgi:hypothetical protein